MRESIAVEIIGIDVGGSSIKAGCVDTHTGEIRDRIQQDLDGAFKIRDVCAAVASIVARIDCDGPIGVGFPAVVQRGIVRSPATSHQVTEWLGYDLAESLSEDLQREVAALNDGDAAGLAEMRFGAARDQDGMVLVFTIGTGIGSVLFIDGVMAPNIELGRIFLDNEELVAEYQAAGRIKTEEGLSWQEWVDRQQRYFSHIERVFSPDLIVVGGGVSQDHEKWMPQLQLNTKILPAQMRNDSGLVGAALAAELQIKR